MHIHTLPNVLDGRLVLVAVVQSRFNQHITDKLWAACKAELEKLNTAGVLYLTVPGALEIPSIAMALAGPHQIHAIIALGAVIRGETYHFEVVSNESARQLGEVGLTMDTPVINGVLTCDSDEQALARVEEKGRECARAAIEMANHLFALDAVFDDLEKLEEDPANLDDFDASDDDFEDVMSTHRGNKPQRKH